MHISRRDSDFAVDGGGMDGMGGGWLPNQGFAVPTRLSDVEEGAFPPVLDYQFVVPQ